MGHQILGSVDFLFNPGDLVGETEGPSGIPYRTKYIPITVSRANILRSSLDMPSRYRFHPTP